MYLLGSMVGISVLRPHIVNLRVVCFEFWYDTVPKCLVVVFNTRIFSRLIEVDGHLSFVGGRDIESDDLDVLF